MLAVLFILIHPFINLAPTALRAFRRGRQLLHSIAAVMCAFVSLIFGAPCFRFLPVEAAALPQPGSGGSGCVLLC